MPFNILETHTQQKKNPTIICSYHNVFYIIILFIFFFRIISWKVSRLVHNLMGGTLWSRFAFVFDQWKRLSTTTITTKTIPKTTKTTPWMNNQYVQYIYFFIFLQDEYNLNPGLEWEDEFTGRYTLKWTVTGIDMKQNRNVPILTKARKQNTIKH